jgi:two-component system, OmpR family, response regulator ResD
MTCGWARRATANLGLVTRVLVADDDNVVRDMLRRYLERDGHEVSAARDGDEAMRILESETIDLAILDVMMPGPDGLAICRTLRERSGFRVQVILLTALTEEADRIAGLEVGADDYVTKPFSPRELTLRVRSVLRRGPATPINAPAAPVTAGGLIVSAAARSVTVDGEPVSLTNREFDLLLFLVTHPDVVFSREELLKRVWQWDFGDLSTVTVHVKRLRSKLGDQHRVQTVWGRGYMWSGGPDAGA